MRSKTYFKTLLFSCTLIFFIVFSDIWSLSRASGPQARDIINQFYAIFSLQQVFVQIPNTPTIVSAFGEPLWNYLILFASTHFHPEAIFAVIRILICISWALIFSPLLSYPRFLIIILNPLVYDVIFIQFRLSLAASLVMLALSWRKFYAFRVIISALAFLIHTFSPFPLLLHSYVHILNRSKSQVRSPSNVYSFFLPLTCLLSFALLLRTNIIQIPDRRLGNLEYFSFSSDSLLIISFWVYLLAITLVITRLYTVYTYELTLFLIVGLSISLFSPPAYRLFISFLPWLSNLFIHSTIPSRYIYIPYAFYSLVLWYYWSVFCHCA